MRKITIITLLFLLNIICVNAQLKLNWKLSIIPGTNVNNTSFNFIKKVAADNQGNLIVCCTKGKYQSKGFTLIKINKYGLVEWQNDYLTNDSVYIFRTMYSGMGYVEDSLLITDNNGNIFITANNYPLTQCNTIKIDANGNIIWQTTSPYQAMEGRINNNGEVILLHSNQSFPTISKIDMSGIANIYIDSSYNLMGHYSNLWVDGDDSVHFIDITNSGNCFKWNLSSLNATSNYFVNYQFPMGDTPLGTLETKNFKIIFKGELLDPAHIIFYNKDYSKTWVNTSNEICHYNSANLAADNGSFYYQNKITDTLKVFKVDSDGTRTVFFSNPFLVDSPYFPSTMTASDYFLNYHPATRYFTSYMCPTINKSLTAYLFDSTGTYKSYMEVPLAKFEQGFELGEWTHVTHINYQNGYTFFAKVNSDTGFLALGFLLGTESNLTGRLFLDVNNNCVWDSTEQPLRNHLVYAAGTNFVTATDTNGIYAFTLPAGSYSIAIENPTMFTNTCGANYNISLASGQIINNLDYPLNYDPNYIDLSTTLSGGNAFSALGSYHFSVHVSNNSFVAKMCNLQVDVDTIFFNISPSVSPTGINGNSFTWNNLLLNAGQDTVINFFCNHPNNTPFGTPFNIVSTVNPVSGTDGQPWNNVSVLNRHFLASLDPNDKHVFPDGAINQNDTLLHYTIRFQNTGNYLAYTVVIIDTLDASLDLTTLKFGYSSHLFNYSFIDGNVLKIEFPNIMLADSNSNEPASHGEVNYYISPKKNLANGTQIQNRAHIYFDFNTPVATNQTLNTFNFSSMDETEYYGIEVYPNPATTIIHINDLNNVVTSLKLIDRIGKEIYTEKISGNKTEINVAAFDEGLYILQLETTLGIVSKKILLLR